MRWYRTYQGVAIITSSLCGMEAFLGNNIKFLQYHDILTFLSNIITEQHKWQYDILSYVDEDKVPTETELLNYLTIEMSEFSCSLEQVQYISKIIKSLSKELQCRIYYKRNLLALLNSKRPLEMLLGCLPKEGDIFSDPNHPLDYLKNPLNDVYKVIREFVGYEYAYHDRYERAMTMKRTSVLVIDTDSNFLYLDALYNHICSNAGLDLSQRSQKSNIINICTVIVYICSQYVQTIMDTHTSNVNIPPNKMPIINMKSEFLYSDLMTTSNKKQYAANMLVREGKVFEQAKLDVKGLSIRKVSVNKTTREYFLDIINDQLLGNDDVTHGDILYAFYDYETRLKDGIMAFDLSFLTPAKYGVFDNYANPWMIQAVRGVFLWNLLNPDEPIQEYSKVKLLKLNITAPEQLLLMEDANMAALLKEKIFDDEFMAHYGIKVIALPLDMETPPEWVKPFVDTQIIISDNLTAAMPLFEAMEFQITTYKAKKYMTNVISVFVD